MNTLYVTSDEISMHVVSPRRVGPPKDKRSTAHGQNPEMALRQCVIGEAASLTLRAGTASLNGLVPGPVHVVERRSLQRHRPGGETPERDRVLLSPDALAKEMRRKSQGQLGSADGDSRNIVTMYPMAHSGRADEVRVTHPMAEEPGAGR